MHETAADLQRLQDLLDRSHADAGAHLRSIITDARRVDAAGLAARLQGMCLLTVATVTARCHPVAGPLDGVFFRGAFHFGTSPESIRRAHLRRRPQVSATHLPGEHFAVTVHGTAVPVDIHSAEHAEFRATLLEVYTPRYGESWESFLDSGPEYFRIEAQRMFTFQMTPPPTPGAVPPSPRRPRARR